MPYLSQTISCQIGSQLPGAGIDWNEAGSTVEAQPRGSVADGIGATHIGIRIPSLDFGTDGSRRFIVRPPSWGGLSQTSFSNDTGIGENTTMIARFSLVDEEDCAVFGAGSARPSDRQLWWRHLDVEFRGLSSGGAIMGDSGLAPIINTLLQWATSGSHPWVEGNSIGIVVTSVTPAAVTDLGALIMQRAPWITVANGGTSGLVLEYAIGAEPSSIADRSVGTRWMVDPRTGMEHPVGDFAQDGEGRNLFVYHRDVDKIGRRATRRNARRERQDRLWPRVT